MFFEEHPFARYMELDTPDKIQQIRIPNKIHNIPNFTFVNVFFHHTTLNFVAYPLLQTMHVYPHAIAWIHESIVTFLTKCTFVMVFVNERF